MELVANASAARVAVALGVISSGGNAAARDVLRSTCFSPHERSRATRTRVLFVIGSKQLPGCASSPASDAGAADLLEIDSVGDCFAAVGGKIHAWYKFALSRFESAAWIAKAEDDGLVDLLALQKLLGTLRRAGGRSHRWYVGRFAWTSTCWPLRESGRRHCAAPLGPATSKPDAPTRRDWDGCCTGCWGGQLRYNPGSATDRGWGGCAPQTETLDRWPPAPLRVGSPVCAAVMSSPFPIGVLEARSKELARAVAGCATADALFEAMSARGAALGGECQACDATQGLAVRACTAAHNDAPLRLANFGPEFVSKWPCHTTDLAWGCRIHRPEHAANASDTVAIHPLKLPGRPASRWRELWAALRARTRYKPAPLDLLEVGGGGAAPTLRGLDTAGLGLLAATASGDPNASRVAMRAASRVGHFRRVARSSFK